MDATVIAEDAIAGDVWRIAVCEDTMWARWTWGLNGI